MKTVIRLTVYILVFISLTAALILTVGCGEPETVGCGEAETENTLLKLLRMIPKDIRWSGVIEIKDYERWRELNQINIYKADNERCNTEIPWGDTSVIGWGAGADEKGKYVILVNVCDDEDSAKKYDTTLENILDYPRKIDVRNDETGELEAKTFIYNDHISEKEKRIEGRVFMAKLYMDEEATEYFFPLPDRVYIP